MRTPIVTEEGVVAFFKKHRVVTWEQLMHVWLAIYGPQNQKKRLSYKKYFMDTD